MQHRLRPRCSGRLAQFAGVAASLRSLLPFAILGACAPLGAEGADRLPLYLDSFAAAKGPTSRPWSIADIIEVRRITGTAISERTREVAFVIKQSFIDGDDIRYGLYVLERQYGRARKITEAAYIDQLAWHPHSDLWSVRGDWGSGIQLYDVDSAGGVHALVVNAHTVVVGAADSVIDADVSEGPRETGVASYEWSPDGNYLWYSTYRLRDPSARAAMASEGIVYDDREMYLHAFYNDPTVVLGAELHVLNPVEASDRLLIFAPGGARAGNMFTREIGSAFWERDSRHIHFALWLSRPDTSAEFSVGSVDILSGASRSMSGITPHELFNAVPAPDGRGYLTVKVEDEGRRLLQMQDGDVLKDYGKVEFNDVGSGYGNGVWYNRRGRGLVLAVNYENRRGLASIPVSRTGAVLSRVPDNLSRCSFTQDISYGVCVRESMATAPELVRISMKDGTVTTAVRVNSQLSPIKQLRIEAGEWMNRYGNYNNGYVTFPRSYVDGRKYPTLIVTHGHSALNEFVNAGLQWEFPIQVLAEQGYFVLSVNEPRVTSRTRAASNTRVGIQGNLTVPEIQFNEALNPVASMEAALTSAIENGRADASKTGIAGYSRGAEIVEYVMTQSKLFHAAIEGDAGGFPAGHYGLEGWAPTRAYYRQLYGGSPFDAGALENYLRLSVSFRSKEFAGPLLQLFTKTNGPAGLEIHSLLRDAGIPTELVFFSNENHIFWDPRHRAAAMQHSIDWLDYWLLGERHHGTGDGEQYDRWDAMAATWRGKAH